MSWTLDCEYQKWIFPPYQQKVFSFIFLSYLKKIRTAFLWLPDSYISGLVRKSAGLRQANRETDEFKFKIGKVTFSQIVFISTAKI